VGPPPRIGPPTSVSQPPSATEPKGPYQAVPDRILDSRRQVEQKPLAAAASRLLALYYRLASFLFAIEQRAPVE
jgi:hypothetical protein